MASKLFHIAKRKILGKLLARYPEIGIEKNFADYIVYRYAGQWLWVIQDKPDGVEITHLNAGFDSRSAFSAMFETEDQLAEMIQAEFKGKYQHAKPVGEALAGSRRRDYAKDVKDYQQWRIENDRNK